tara:strand:+ start:483 stop:1547 length:1065 start_codon:yes stop_codon:yes gene_type:complete
MTDPEELLRQQFEAEREREDALESARQMRRAAKTISEVKAENRELHQAVDVLEEHLSVREALAKAIAKPPVVRLKKTKEAAVVPLAIMSDQHWDETFSLEQTGGINEQNPEIAEAKVENLIHRLLKLIEREQLSSPVPHMVMPLLGDMIAGELHPKSERDSPMTPTEATRFAYRLTRRIIDSLLASDMPRILIPCVDGNHDRTTAKRTPGLNQRYSHAHDLYLRLADHYEEAGEKRVEFYIPQTDFATMEICPGFSICITHGDSVRGGQGIGGLAPPLLRAVSRWRQAYPADLYLLGHHHQYWDLGSVCVNGCSVGYNPYAASLGLAPSPPMQLFTTVHTGRLSRATTCPIWVD